LPEEVIVVGRREDMPAQQVVADFAKRGHLSVRWVEVDKPGHIAPIKRGLEETKCEIVAFLDGDTEPEQGWLQALLEPFTNPKVAPVQ
jgi:cellulose synthase/poly-beta-1,6-N-acetylglucosamine synthase-like glycosyltransferase